MFDDSSFFSNLMMSQEIQNRQEKWPRPKGFAAEGHWFFIQMVPEKEENLPKPSSRLISASWNLDVQVWWKMSGAEVFTKKKCVGCVGSCRISGSGWLAFNLGSAPPGNIGDILVTLISKAARVSRNDAWQWRFARFAYSFSNPQMWTIIRWVHLVRFPAVRPLLGQYLRFFTRFPCQKLSEIVEQCDQLFMLHPGSATCVGFEFEHGAGDHWHLESWFVRTWQNVSLCGPYTDPYTAPMFDCWVDWTYAPAQHI